MKEKIVAQLKAKYKTLISDKQIESLADYLAITVTEETQIETAVNGVENLVKASQGEADKVRTEAAKTKKELEDKLKTLLTGANPEPEAPKTDDTPEWAKGLIARLDQIESDKTKTSRKSTLDKMLEGIPDNYKAPFNLIKLDAFTEEEITGIFESVGTQIESIKTDLATKGVVFSPPSGGNGFGGKTVAPTESEIKELNSKIDFKRV